MSNVGQGREHRKTLVQTLSESITGHGLVGSGVFLVALGGVAWLIKGIFDHSPVLSLPILALISILLLLGALLVFTTLIHLIDLSDAKSALGLPEGSVRALLALALLGLFAIMASSVLVASPPREVKGLQLGDIDAVLKANPNDHDIFWVPETQAPGQAQTFTAVLGSPSHVDDFAKQMLTLVGTLMTAVISFYFGSATFSSSPAQGESGGEPNPTGISPITATDEAAQLYTITGTRLANVTRVEAIPENGGTPVVADAKASGAEAKATLKLSKGKWTFHVYTASGAQAAVPVSIDVTEKSPAGGTTPARGTTPAVGTMPATTVANPAEISPQAATNGVPQPYKVTGTNLGSVTKAEAVPTGGGSAVAATNLHATDTAAMFELSLSTGTWTLQIASGTASPIPVPGTITVT
jgi:hypothetical protein